MLYPKPILAPSIEKGSISKWRTTLTRPYAAFCAFETISINFVGFFTLIFQNEMADLIHPGRLGNEATIDEQYQYQFWFYHEPLAFNINRKEMCLALMVAGWLMLAGFFQAAIIFDPQVVSVRAKVAVCALLVLGV